MHNKRVQMMNNKDKFIEKPAVQVKDFRNTLPSYSNHIAPEASSNKKEVGKFNSQNIYGKMYKQMLHTSPTIRLERAKPKSMVQRNRKAESSLKYTSIKTLCGDTQTDLDSISTIKTPRCIFSQTKIRKSRFQKKLACYEYVRDKREYQPSLPPRKHWNKLRREKKSVNSPSTIFRVVKNHKPFSFDGTVSLNPRLVLETPKKDYKDPDYNFCDVKPRFPSTKDQHPSLKSNSKRPSTVITSSRQPLINENSVLHRDFLKFLSDNNIKVTHSSPPKVTSATSSPRVCSQR
ncbi:unnamed protein product [Moneuplotes crassus]|uniref:Uncharacterized protein n=1 Tax=Euplotes crassus TaxID=5936 RepID=A0AAD1XHU2_EUPCR|nr:unnamed protein product [Moneuplotes crassus]